MSNHRTFTRSIIVLFILGLSLLMVGCKGDFNDVKSVDDSKVPTIDSTVTIDANVTEGEAPLKVKFFAKSDDLILGQSWNFGDGATAETLNSNSNVKHTFTEEGTYTVTLNTATNLGGAQTDSITITVGSGKSFPVTTVYLVNLFTDLTLYSVVGNSSVGDTDFNFSLQESDPDNASPGLIEPGEEGFIEVRCDVSWELDAFFTDGDDLDAHKEHRGMELYSCGVEYEWVFFEPPQP